MVPIPSQERDRQLRQFADMYTELGIEDSHYIAYRDVPTLLNQYCTAGKRALAYGCGAGRSTTFLHRLGFDVDGVDINPHILDKARLKDNTARYHLVESGVLPFQSEEFDLVFCGIVLVEVSSMSEIVKILREMKRVKKQDGIIMLLVSSPEGYKTDSGQFLGDLPENTKLRSGDSAKVIRRGSELSFFDYYWEDKDFRQAFADVDLECVGYHRPIPTDSDMDRLLVKSNVARWVIYVCRDRTTLPKDNKQT